MDVRINERACTFEAVESGTAVTAITWDWARERGAQFRAELLTVAVDTDGAVYDEPPGGWVDEVIKTRVVNGETVPVQTVKRLPADADGWTISERWKMRAWSPLRAGRVTVEVAGGVSAVNGGDAGPGATGIDDGTWEAVRFTRTDGRLVDDVIVRPVEASLDLVAL